MRRIVHVVGARPNFMKVAPMMRELSKYPHQFEQLLLHTGQHYDDNMSRVFFEDLVLPNPDIYLGVGSGSHAQQTARIMLTCEPVLMKHRPDLVIVVGDVNSTLACALTAAKLGIKVAHLESGLRSFDRTMPEEINRRLTDHIADLLFTTEPSANENLCREGIDSERIHFVGNLMIDMLVQQLPKANERWNTIYSNLKFRSKTRDLEHCVLVTLHRPSNVDEVEKLRKIMQALVDIAQEVPVIFPVHPRTRSRMENAGEKIEYSNLIILNPLGYLDFLALMSHATLVVTDSGGIQEETTYLGVPCLTLRNTTERPITITQGTNELVNLETIRQHIDKIMDGTWKKGKVPEMWDGKSAERIVNVLLRQVD
jgi:UDP-N-acetylglucosamine 2-epimerase (non-hydrolysing)